MASACFRSFDQNDASLAGFEYKLMNQPMPVFLTREGIDSMSKNGKRNFSGVKSIREMMKERLMSKKHKDEKQLIDCLINGDFQTATELIPKVKNINFIDPKIGKSALHIAAIDSMLGILECLWKREDLDVLLLDSDGNRASHLAWVEVGNQALGIKLVDIEVAEKLRRKSLNNPELS